MFPEEYPHKCLMVEVKSKSLPERVMKLIENIAEKEAKKLKGQYQVKKTKQYGSYNTVLNILFPLKQDIWI